MTAFSPRVLRAQAAASARRFADPDAELTLAGLLLLAPERAAGLALDPEDFTEPVAAALVRAFVELSAGGTVPTAAAVVARAKELHPGVRVAEASQLISRVAALDEGAPLAGRVRGLADVRRALEALAARQVEIIQAPDPVTAARAVLARLDGARPGPAAPAGPADDFPEPPDPAAFHGLAGRFVEVVSPYSEADPVALLSTFLAVFGAVVGRGGPERPGPFFPVEADRHHPNLFIGLVGPTARGRKGTSAGRCLGLFRLVDEAFVADRVVEGLSSGEGLIWAVRDPIYRTVTRKGEPVTELADEGVADKRLLVLETEFGGVLKSLDRQGNTLSAVIRRAWDTGDLQVLTKNSPARATGAHIAIVAHITREELARYLSETEQANGFANRFIWLAVRRARLLPDGEAMPPPARQELEALAREVARRVELARRLNRVGRSPEAAEAWAAVYPKLSADRPGLVGAVLARAEAQVVRLSLVYALLGGSTEVRPDHLEAALALWEYAERSARWVFGERTGDPVADAILGALRAAGPQGLSRTEIHGVLSRHVPAGRINAALEHLRRAGLAGVEWVKTGGRPAELWRAV